MTSLLISAVTFEEWIRLIFDNPIAERAWENGWIDAEAIDLDAYHAPQTAIAYLTRLFEEAGAQLAPYQDAQVGRGLYYLIANTTSEHGLALVNTTVPLAERIRCLRAMQTVYTAIFAPRCPAQFIQTLEAPDMLQLTCYMWWDVLPFTAQPQDPAQAPLDRTALDVMIEALRLPSIACQESALHGLGHWQHAYPAVITPAIDRYLAATPDLPPELAAYARAARSGCVQ